MIRLQDCMSTGLPTRLAHAAVVAASALFTTATVQAGAGATLFFEQFEDLGFVPIGEWGPQGLIDRGWVFENNSEPLGPVAWVAGCCWEPVITPLSGQEYLAAYQDSAAGGAPQYSAWAIMPLVDGQQDGDILTFFTVSSDTSPFESVHLEVRYASSGGADVGTAAGDVGDFTQNLLTISPMPNYNSGPYDGWTKWEIELPGPGRIAFRQIGEESMYFGIEDVSVTTPEPPGGPLPEDFEDLEGTCGEGPCKLVDLGWTFVDQGTVSAAAAWQPSFPNDNYDAHSGVSFMKTYKGGGGSIATWAIPPDIGAQNGDELSFFVRGILWDDGVFEVRYSPTGGTDTGSGASDVGDFSDVLVAMQSLSPNGWQPVTVTLPGDGRIALRVYDPNQSFFDPLTIAGVDTMDLNAELPGPPLPQSGETVTWTADMNPITIDTDLFIVEGGTVIVEPGVQIDIAAESTLAVGGMLQGVGTASNPISIASASNFPPGIVVNGTIDLAHATINTQVRPAPHGSLLFSDCIFAGANAIVFNELIYILDENDAPPYLEFDGCTFDGANLMPTDAIMSLRNSNFINGSAIPLRGYVLVDELTFDGGRLDLSKDQQPVYINSITARNAPGPGINVGGGNFGNDFFFGPDNVLTNNGYTAGVSDGGILPGSTLPDSGNVNNAIAVTPVGNELRGPFTWSDPGIPYHVLDSAFVVGEANLLPGATLKFAPGQGFSETGALQARGLPDAPVTFEPLSGQWDSIFTPYRLEYAVVDGSEFGIVNAAVGLPGFYDSTTFSNNNRAIVGSAIIRKSQFLNNNVGADVGFTMDLDGQTGANTFVGNTLAVESASDATHNWWGASSGPNGPQNPGGTGDPVVGGVPVAPFLTEPPDFNNHPPIIHLNDLYFVASPGSTVLLIWDAIDADLASQRVMISTGNDVPGDYQVIATLPPDQRAYALTVPNIDGVFNIRVEGVDELGQVGWDHSAMGAKMMTFDPDLVPGDTFKVGYPIPLSDDVSLGDNGFILLDGQYRSESFGAPGVLPPTIMASTDTVRLGTRTNTGNWTFGNYFTVRPDERLGDAAPAVELLSPDGGSYSGGSTISIAWNASDDEAVRSATVQASYNGGLTWNEVVSDLPGDTTNYAWQLPPLEDGISNVRIRVVVFDLRFQSSSATSGSIAFTPGDGSVIGDIDDDGSVGVSDLLILLSEWGVCDDSKNCPADLDGDGSVGVSDLLSLLANWG